MAKGGSTMGDEMAKGGSTMSGNPDGLRKKCDNITPFKRAVMIMEAAERIDDEAQSSLGPDTLYDGFYVSINCLAFHILAFTAVYESQKGDALYWSSLAIMRQRLMEGGKLKDGASVKTWQEQIQCGKRRARAWLLALEALDKETGGACMPCARIFAGEYIRYIMGRDVEEETDYSAELERLRELWTTSRSGFF